jgi:hypothetical protein
MMKKITLILALIFSTYTFSQHEKTAEDSAFKLKQRLYNINNIVEAKDFMSNEEFMLKLTDVQNSKIDEQSKKEWISSFTNQDKEDIKTVNEQLSKKHLISWSANKYGYPYGINATVTNSSGKTIKYITFKTVSINSVGDPISMADKKVNGPVENGESGAWPIDVSGLTDLVNTNNEISYIKITSFIVEYTDLTTQHVNDIKKVTIDSDLERRLNQINTRLETIKYLIKEEMYRVEKVKHDEEIEALIVSQKKLKDSIDLSIEKTKSDIIFQLYRKEFRYMNIFLNKCRKSSMVIIELNKLDDNKKKFIKIMYDIDVEKMSPFSEKILRVTNIVYGDTTTLKGLKDFIEKNESSKSNNFKSKISEIFDITDSYQYKGHTKLISDTISHRLFKNQDFMQNKLKKTDLYKMNEEEYKRKEIEAIIPIKKHISILYVYGGGRSPYGINLAVYPKSKLGIYFEYLTQPQLDGLTNDNILDYGNPEQASKLFEDIKEKNIYKLEDTWDKKYTTINLGINLPVNYKQNLIIGLGIGRTNITEYKRYQLPNNFISNSIFGPSEGMKGIFYLESEKRNSYNLNYNANIYFIAKPFTIKIGVTVNDRDRRDTRLNLGIGLTF